MSTPTKPTLEELAKRNTAVSPDRVREMQAVLKKLQDLGVLKPPTYGIQPALGGHLTDVGSGQVLRTMNRVDGSQ